MYRKSFLDDKHQVESEELSLQELVKQNQQILTEFKKINNHKLILAYNSIPKLLWFHLLKGVAFGLGSALGATVVLSGLVYLLTQIEFIPVIGDIVKEILVVVKSAN